MIELVLWVAMVVSQLVVDAALQLPIRDRVPMCQSDEGTLQHPAVPATVYVIEADSNRVSNLAALTIHEYGIVKWTANAEHLLFLGASPCGPALSIYEPRSGRAVAIANPVQFWEYDYGDAEDSITVVTRHGDVRLRLPGPLADGQPQPVDAVSGVRVCDGNVYADDVFIAEKRGRDWSLLPSPSGRWVALIARQPIGALGLYRIDPSGKDVEWIGIVPDGQRLERDTSLLSDDNMWQLSADGTRIVKAGSVRSSRRAVWSPGNIEAAVILEGSIWIVSREARPRLLVAGCCSTSLIDWDENGLWYAVGTYGVGDN